MLCRKPHQRDSILSENTSHNNPLHVFVPEEILTMLFVSFVVPWHQRIVAPKVPDKLFTKIHIMVTKSHLTAVPGPPIQQSWREMILEQDDFRYSARTLIQILQLIPRDARLEVVEEEGIVAVHFRLRYAMTRTLGWRWLETDTLCKWKCARLYSVPEDHKKAVGLPHSRLLWQASAALKCTASHHSRRPFALADKLALNFRDLSGS